MAYKVKWPAYRAAKAAHTKLLGRPQYDARVGDLAGSIEGTPRRKIQWAQWRAEALGYKKLSAAILSGNVVTFNYGGYTERGPAPVVTIAIPEWRPA